VRKKEEEAAEQSIFFLRFLVYSPLDWAKIWTAASRHVTLNSERLDWWLVVWTLVVLTENRVVSVVSFSLTLLSLILLYSKNRLFLMIYVVALSWIWGRTIVNPLFVIVEFFRWTTVPWFFPHWVFHIKILALICVIVALYLFIVWFCFLLHKEGKGLGLVNCELYSAELIRLVVPSFPNKVVSEHLIV